MLAEALFFVNTTLSVTNNMGLVLSLTNCFRYKSRAHLALLSFAGWVLGYVIERGRFSLPRVEIAWLYLIPPVILVVLTAVSYPTSISQLYISTLLGYSLALGFTDGVLIVGTVVLSWLFSFLCGTCLSFSLKKVAEVLVKPVNTGRVLALLKVLSAIYVFLLSYVLGGNLVSVIASLLGLESNTTTMAIACLSVGAAILLSLRTGVQLGIAKVLFPPRYVTSLIPYTVAIALTQLANAFGLPLALSLVMFSSTLGVGLASKFRVIYRERVVRYIVWSYVIPFAISTLSSYTISSVILTLDLTREFVPTVER